MPPKPRVTYQRPFTPPAFVPPDSAEQHLARILEDLGLVLQGQADGPARVAITAAAALERAARTLAELELHLVDRQEVLRRQRVALERRVQALRALAAVDDGAAAAPAEEP